MNRRDIVQVLAMAAFLVSAVTVASYLFNVPHLRTWSDPPMALNTGICFLVLSLAILVREGGTR